jgi:hypothetical protein
MDGMKQFSIRDLLFLVVIVALALGWWLDRRPVAARFQLNSSGNRAFLVDTATGQVWTQGYTPGSTVTGDGGLLPPKLPK